MYLKHYSKQELPMIKVAIISFFIFGFSKCRTGEPLPPSVKLFIGDSDQVSICRDDGSKIECIYASSEEFNSYTCTSNDDLIKITEYINELRSKCTSYEEKK